MFLTSLAQVSTFLTPTIKKNAQLEPPAMDQIVEIRNTATKFTVKASAEAQTRPDLNSHLKF